MVDMSVCWRIIIVHALFVYDVYIDNIPIFLLHTHPLCEWEIVVFTVFKYVVMLYYIVDTRWLYYRI